MVKVFYDDCTHASVQARSPEKRLFEPESQQKEWHPKKKPSGPSLSTRKISQNKNRQQSQESAPKQDPTFGSASAIRWEKAPTESSKSSSDFLIAKRHSLTCQTREKKKDDKLEKENPNRKRRTLRKSKV